MPRSIPSLIGDIEAAVDSLNDLTDFVDSDLQTRLTKVTSELEDIVDAAQDLQEAASEEEPDPGEDEDLEDDE